MEITIKISDEDLNDDTKEIIQQCLDLENDELDDALKKICKSAFMEYVKMFRERGLPNRADEVKQDRLFFLLLHYFESRVPHENEISTIFQITLPQSRTLLRNTNSRYRTLVLQYLRNSLRQVVESAELNGETEKYEMIVQSRVFLEELNMVITQRNARLSTLRKVPDSAAKYECPVDTYNLLNEIYG